MCVDHTMGITTIPKNGMLGVTELSYYFWYDIHTSFFTVCSWRGEEGSGCSWPVRRRCGGPWGVGHASHRCIGPWARPWWARRKWWSWGARGEPEGSEHLACSMDSSCFTQALCCTAQYRGKRVEINRELPVMSQHVVIVKCSCTVKQSIHGYE